MMKQHLLKLGLLCIALSLLLCGCLDSTSTAAGGTGTTADTTEETPIVATPPTHYYTTMQYTYQTIFDPAIVLTGLQAEYLLLVNKSNPLGEDYAPASLTTLTCPTNAGKTVELESRAASALYAMLAEMQADGVTDILVTSGYRSYEYQILLNNHYHMLESSGFSEEAYKCLGAAYIQSEYLDAGKTSLSQADIEKVVRSYSAEPGKSEHQSGLCVDFVTSEIGLTEAFEGTEAFAWLSQNAYRFGFVLRYPKDEVAVTGYTYEPWHYRFVGREAATDMHFGSLTLEEYLVGLGANEQ